METERVRASMGTLAVLGMELLTMKDPPTTAYLQVYSDERCLANCQFCSQARKSKGELKRIAYGLYIPADLKETVRRLAIAYKRGYLRRACIQTIMSRSLWEDLVYLVKGIRKQSEIPISVSVFPIEDEKFLELKNLGVDNIVIPLDACTEKIFERVKGKEVKSPHRWSKHLDAIERAVKIFGKGSVGTHFILGLGESEEEAVKIIDNLNNLGVYSALFAFTPIRGAQLEKDKPSISYYRRIQLAHSLISKGIASYESMRFSDGKIVSFGLERKRLIEEIEDGRAFVTKGCKDCNRPFATERPRQVYNYPNVPTKKEIKMIKMELEGII